MSTKIPQSLDEVLLWIAHHDGVNEARWEQQEARNTEMWRQIAKAAERISTLERRVVALCCAAAAGGSILGTQLPPIF